MTACALCLRIVGELRNSHIIPEFLYEAMYDDKHRFQQITVGEARESLVQKGLREKLLCADCEQRIGRWERYASGVLSGRTALRYEELDRFAWVHGVEYAPFKLFGMSVLWRASVSKQQFFAQVRLGPHEESLRAMLLASDPGPPHKYGCLLAEMRLQGEHAPVIIEPTEGRLDGIRVMRFVFGGYAWTYVVASHKPRPEVCQAFLQASGRMALLRGELLENPLFRDLIARL